MDSSKMNDPLIYRRILLTVDEDDNTSSERAFRYATTLARDYEVPLGIVSVMESEDINIFDSLTPSKIQAKRRHVEQVVQDYVDLAKKDGIAEVEPLVYEGGDVDDVILEQVIPDFKPDLLVTGADTQFAHSKIAGAIGPRLARKAPISVIVVR
ncbi:universal stress protein [Lactiplantibacillus sp. WILCCON 0030]|uniref:Universal stress protein n=1 Tax=Lactiplantibacillus brownii TaxID=3069269 RepID=A0ABU1ACR3_9LACO|nr:universal stress protein [Lactiplantibacillus brownii]MDQ7938710.1 universal stress protein [Lactiplantibacillus brownii]